MRRGTAYPAAIALGLAMLAPASVGLACTCGRQPTVAEAAAASHAVFVATVRSLALDYSKHERITTFEVHRVFKGLVPPSIRVVSALSEAACGFSFARDTTYLVFTNPVSGRPFTSLCAGNRIFVAGQPYPPELGAGSPPLVLAP